MGLPRKLKDFMLFNNGEAYLGKVPEITLPELSRKMEEYRAAGMSGPVEVDFGNEAITLEWTAGGLLPDALKQYASDSHSGVQLRFAGAYQNDDDGTVCAVEIIVRGRHKEIDMGSAKHASDTEHKFSTACSYYKLSLDAEVFIELDFMAGTEIVGGTDRRAGIRKAIGL